QFALAPVFASGAAALVDFDRVRITVTRSLTGRIAADTVVRFPPGADSIEAAIAVTLEAAKEEFLVFARLINAAGDTVFRNDPYPQAVTAVAGRSSAPVQALLRYVGIGFDAVAVVIASADTVVPFGQSVDLTAQAFGADQQPIPGTPVAWSSLDPLLASVPDAASGRVVGGAARGRARVVAELIAGAADTALVTVQPLASLLDLVGGDRQEGIPGSFLGLPLRVRVTAPDGLGVRVPVRFRARTLGASVADSVVASDADGFAETIATLSLDLSLQEFEASADTLPPVVFTAQAVTDVASVTVTPTSASLDLLGGTVQFAAEAHDTSGAPLAVTFTWSSSDPAVATVDPATGLATALGNGSATIRAMAEGVMGSAAMDVVQVVTQLVFSVPPSDITAGLPISPAVEVSALDAGGSVATNFTDDVALSRGDLIECVGTLLGTTTIPAVGGVAKFADLVIQQACPGLQLAASSGNLTSPPSDPFTVLPGTATQLVYRTQPSKAVAGAVITPPVEVEIQDQFGNVVPTWTTPVSVQLSDPLLPLGGTLTVDPVNGVATFRDLTVDLVGLGYTLVASSTSLPAAPSDPFDITLLP
ncbi:MAG: Ig-like domain-containing protein, partial [Gemmatimonadales bacterium]